MTKNNKDELLKLIEEGQLIINNSEKRDVEYDEIYAILSNIRETVKEKLNKRFLKKVKVSKNSKPMCDII